MSESKPKYYDIRESFWQRHFEAAASYDDYLAASEAEKAQKWRDMAQKIPALSEEQVKRLAPVQRQINVLMYSGVWCGDCVRQGPMLERLCAACHDARLRVIDRDASEELKDEVRILGAMRVPVVIFLTEQFMEIGRFGDRLLSVYRAKAERELGPTCDTGLVAPPPDQLSAELGEWVDVFERMLLMARLAPGLRQLHND